MGRNIKHYIGTYGAQTGSYYGNQSTGYTVPSGKVARIGFNVMAAGGATTGYNSALNGVSGFYAGSGGSTSSGSNTNRFLLAHTHTTDGAEFQGASMTLTYDAANGSHRWSAPSYSTTTPQLWIGDNHRERYTSRSNNMWYYNNFYYVTNASDGVGYTSWGARENTTIKYQSQHFAPAYAPYLNNSTQDTGSRVGGLIDAFTTNGPVHAFAGETIYLFDFNPGAGYNNVVYRNWQKCAWSMFIIEEDA